jgi:hypothetical protein
LSCVGLYHLVNGDPKPSRIGEKRGYIAKHDPVMGEILDRANVILDGFGVGHWRGFRDCGIADRV